MHIGRAESGYIIKRRQGASLRPFLQIRQNSYTHRPGNLVLVAVLLQLLRFFPVA